LKTIFPGNIADNFFFKYILHLPTLRITSEAANMQSTRQLTRAILRRTSLAPPSSRFLSSSLQLRAEDNARRHPNADAYGESQKNKANVPHMTNTTSTFDEKMPSIGKDKPPPEFISSVDPNYKSAPAALTRT
jgi:hypothetical protein